VTAWRRKSDAGWLQGKPAYETEDGKYYAAQDYDDLDSGSQKLMWFLHDENGFIQAFDTFREVKAHVG
jgi:hypothetical protein